MRRFLRVALCLGLVALAAFPAVVFAHAELVAAEPAAGAQLQTSPQEVRLTFSEPVGAGSFITVYGEGFQMVPRVEARSDAAHPEQLVASLPPLEPGLYTVQYSVASADGHESAGSYTFSVAPDSLNVPARTGLIAVAGVAALLAIGLLVVWRVRR